MFLRVKSTPDSPRKSVQLVQSFRETGKPRLRNVRHTDFAEHDEQLLELRQSGERVKLEEIHKQPESLPDMLKPDCDSLAIELIKTRHERTRHPTFRGGVFHTCPKSGGCGVVDSSFRIPNRDTTHWKAAPQLSMG